MHGTVFGNLDEWGRVLEQLGELTRSGAIERHQEDLAMLLRYQDNWRLREAALEAIPAIQRPTEALIREVCRIMLNDGLYYQIRVLAAEVLNAIIDRLPPAPQDQPTSLRCEIREHIRALLDTQDVPVLHQAVRRILPKIA
ncbi:MAG TPA: hypothetical protein PKG54_04225 [Phycisphaerae bacterium]|jgi:hypothetical protein|nr:hypothetical protein [Phycisphaerae bacterium]HOB73711.1 hypothetical protein [Phycisphaerae bacterium]HOJ53415.1 hypothetical protein [Phycisphaerae bacterium]HOL25461.1 hypothetical protein [Phycisphaerae bacterium]HPP19862.1 hypothetical protein [Phycisphaerae bacterium]